MIFESNMIIYYGNLETYIDVTNICFEKLTKNNYITIPKGDDVRASYFTDPLHGIKKYIFIKNNDNLTTYDDSIEIKIQIKLTMELINIKIYDFEIKQKVLDIHSKLKIHYGNLDEEFPEQKMAVRYLTGKEKVLEIGGNIGRNSLVIATILENSSNLVTLESDINIANQLTENRDLNNLNFHIENSALSKRNLIQRGWDTKPSDILEEGYNWVNTITLDNLKNKYNIDFDTLVLDCEGAFYYILMDMPEILNNINLIIMENDYYDITHKNYVDEQLKNNNFYVDYTEAGGWGECYHNFFEVWKKKI
jgi:FkbM family methyltransferase